MLRTRAPAGVKAMACILFLNPVPQPTGTLTEVLLKSPAFRRNTWWSRWPEMPPPCDTSSSPALITTRTIQLHPVHPSTFLWPTLHRSVHTNIRGQESYPYTDYIQASLRLRGKSCGGCFGCKPIPARLSPFSPPVPELLQHGCSQQR